MTPDLLACLVAALALLAVGCLVLSANTQRGPAPALETVLYDGQDPAAPPLLAVSLRLRARPAAVVRSASDHVAVILARPGLAPGAPAAADVIQLAAAIMVAEEALALPAPHGLLRYQDRAILVALTPQLRALVQQRLAVLRASESRGPHLTSQNPAVCRACAFRAMCAIGRNNAPAPHSSLS